MRDVRAVLCGIACFIVLAVGLRSDGVRNDVIPRWALGLFEACTEKRLEKACADAFEKVLEEGRLWGDARAHYLQGRAAWLGEKLHVRVSNDREREGAFDVLLQGQDARAELTLSYAFSLPEMLITLNHELTHYANSAEFLRLINGGAGKASPCISAYQRAVLLDENRAFRSELAFWKKAPGWFQPLFAGVAFRSKIAGKQKMTYSQYYSSLAISLQADPHYASKRYVELGQYPRCALQLLTR